MQESERKALEESRRDEMKSNTQKDLEKYYGLVKDRELDLFKVALKKADEIIPKIGRCHFDVIKEGNKVCYRLLQDLRAFSQAMDEIEKKAAKYMTEE